MVGVIDLVAQKFESGGGAYTVLSLIEDHLSSLDAAAMVALSSKVQMLVVPTASWTTVTLTPTVRYRIVDVGYDSGAAAQPTAKVFFTTDGTEPALGFGTRAGLGYLLQSTSTYQPSIPLFGVTTLKLKALTAESTVMVLAVDK